MVSQPKLQNSIEFYIKILHKNVTKIFEPKHKLKLLPETIENFTKR